MKASKLLLLVAILVTGGMLQLTASARGFLFGPAGCRFVGSKFFGPSFAFESDERKQVPAKAAVEIDNAFGTVRVRAGEPGTVGIHMRTVVFMSKEQEARAFAGGIHIQSVLEGSRLRVSSNRKDFDLRDVGFETHLELSVPADTAVRVRDEHGAVDVSGVAEADLATSYDDLRVDKVAGPTTLSVRHGDTRVAEIAGALALTSRYGDVSVRDVGAAATIDAAHGDLELAGVGSAKLNLQYGNIAVKDVRGDLDVTGEHADVKASGIQGNAGIATTYDGVHVEKVKGDARLKTAHGAVHAEDVGGAVTAEASYDGVSLLRVDGPVRVKVEHGGVEGRDLRKGAQIDASGEDVTLEGFAGPLEVQARRGGVRLVPGAPLSAPVAVTTANGGIELLVPAGSGFDLDAASTSGDVEVDLPGFAASQKEPRRLVGKIGAGGSLVSLKADHGDVSVTAHASVASKDDHREHEDDE